MLKCFLAKSLKLVSQQIASMGTGIITQKMIPSDSIPGRFDFIACSSTVSNQETNHSSLLFITCPHFLCWTNTLYTMLTSRAIRKQLWPYVLSLCTSPIQQLAVSISNNIVARNVFYGGYSVLISLPFMHSNFFNKT